MLLSALGVCCWYFWCLVRRSSQRLTLPRFEYGYFLYNVFEFDHIFKFHSLHPFFSICSRSNPERLHESNRVKINLYYLFIVKESIGKRKHGK